MPEDAAPTTDDLEQALGGDTPDAPEPADPDTGTPAESAADSPAEVNWQERYTEAQSWATRAAQEASEYRQLLDAARNGDPEALAQLGLEVEAEEDDFDDDLDEPMSRREWQQYLQEQQAEQEAVAAEEAQLDQDAADIREGLADRDLSDEELDFVLLHATSNRDTEGRPDVKGALDRIDAIFENRRKSYMQSKKADQVAVGTAGTEKIDLNDDEAVTNWLAAQLEGGQES